MTDTFMPVLLSDARDLETIAKRLVEAGSQAETWRRERDEAREDAANWEACEKQLVEQCERESARADTLAREVEAKDARIAELAQTVEASGARWVVFQRVDRTAFAIGFTESFTMASNGERVIAVSYREIDAEAVAQAVTAACECEAKDAEIKLLEALCDLNFSNGGKLALSMIGDGCTSGEVGAALDKRAQEARNFE